MLISLSSVSKKETVHLVAYNRVGKMKSHPTRPRGGVWPKGQYFPYAAPAIQKETGFPVPFRQYLLR